MQESVGLVDDSLHVKKSLHIKMSILSEKGNLVEVIFCFLTKWKFKTTCTCIYSQKSVKHLVRPSYTSALFSFLQVAGRKFEIHFFWSVKDADWFSVQAR